MFDCLVSLVLVVRNETDFVVSFQNDEMVKRRPNNVWLLMSESNVDFINSDKRPDEQDGQSELDCQCLLDGL